MYILYLQLQIDSYIFHRITLKPKEPHNEMNNALIVYLQNLKRKAQRKGKEEAREAAQRTEKKASIN